MQEREFLEQTRQEALKRGDNALYALVCDDLGSSINDRAYALGRAELDEFEQGLKLPEPKRKKQRPLKPLKARDINFLVEGRHIPLDIYASCEDKFRLLVKYFPKFKEGGPQDLFRREKISEIGKPYRGIVLGLRKRAQYHGTDITRKF